MWFDLCVELKQPGVRYIQSYIDSRDFSEWIAYYNIRNEREGIAPKRTEPMTGQEILNVFAGLPNVIDNRKDN